MAVHWFCQDEGSGRREGGRHLVDLVDEEGVDREVVLDFDEIPARNGATQLLHAQPSNRRTHWLAGRHRGNVATAVSQVSSMREQVQ